MFSVLQLHNLAINMFVTKYFSKLYYNDVFLHDRIKTSQEKVRVSFGRLDGGSAPWENHKNVRIYRDQVLWCSFFLLCAMPLQFQTIIDLVE